MKNNINHFEVHNDGFIYILDSSIEPGKDTPCFWYAKDKVPAVYLERHDYNMKLNWWLEGSIHAIVMCNDPSINIFQF